MGFWGTLGKGLGIAGAGLGGLVTGGASWAAIPALLASGAGAALAAGSQASASNRGATIESLLTQDRNRLGFAQNQRESDTDMLRKMAQTSYLKGGGYQGPTGAAAGLPSFGFRPRPASPEQMQAATTLQGQLMQRLNNPLQPNDISKYTKPSGWEKFMQIASPILTGLGGISQAGQANQRVGTPPFIGNANGTNGYMPNPTFRPGDEGFS